MHYIQEKLLKTMEHANISNMTLRDIGNLIGEKSAQKIKHHLIQLSKKGFITYDPSNKKVVKIRKQGISLDGLVSLPVIGAADCGPAKIFAEENIQGYLKISKRLVPQGRRLYVLRANGNSMNKASVNKKKIEDGDFIVVDADRVNPAPNEYIVSIIDDVANIKKFIPDPQHRRIILQSESTKDYLPIFIHEEDSYSISGTVVDVIKK